MGKGQSLAFWLISGGIVLTGEGEAVGEGEGAGLKAGEGEPVGEGDAVGETEGDGEGEAVGEGVGEGVAVADGDGEGEVVCAQVTVAEKARAVMTITAIKIKRNLLELNLLSFIFTS